jgi:hypothetical protein
MEFKGQQWGKRYNPAVWPTASARRKWPRQPGTLADVTPNSHWDRRVA